MTTDPKPRSIDVAAVTPLNVIGDEIRPLITGDDTGGAYEVFILDGAKDSGPPPHKHPWSEGYLVLDGSVAVLVGDEWVTLSAGQAAHVPADHFHSYKVLSDGARFVVTTGAGAHRFFAEMDANVHELPRDIPTMVGVAMRNGLELTPEAAAALGA